MILQFSNDCNHTSNQGGISTLGVTLLYYAAVASCCPIGEEFLAVGVQRDGCQG